MPSFFKSISGLLTSSVRHLTGTEEEKVQDKNGKIIYCSTAESPYATERKQTIVMVYFNANGGTGEMEAKRVFAGMFTLPKTCDFTPPTEKVFKGWALTATGEPIVAEKIEIKTNTTLYAVWTDKLYKISFEADGGYGPPGSGTMAPQYSPYKVNCPECTFTPAEGYAFRGWAKSYGGSRIRTWPITVSSDITLYALWEVLHTVYFDANGGTGTQAPITTMPGLVTLPTVDELTITPPTGGTFKGWSTDPSGLGEIITQVTVGKDADVFLYAIWEVEDPYYYISFERNGGVGEDMPDLKVPKSLPLYAFPACTYTYDGKYFNGWGFAADSKSGFEPGEKGTPALGQIWFALWFDAPMYVTVSFDSNGGTGAMDPINVRSHPRDVAGKAPDCSFTREGYEFLSWNTEADGTGTEYLPGDILKDLPGDFVLYAIWNQLFTYTYTFYPGQGCTGSPYQKKLTAEDYEFLHQVYLPPIDESHIQPYANYKFAKWLLDQSDRDSGYGEGIPRVTMADETVYCYCVPTSQRLVRFLPNGGKGDGLTCTLLPNNNSITLPTCPYKNAGHSFRGWSLTADGSSPIYQQNVGYTLTTVDTVFYAIWW